MSHKPAPKKQKPVNGKSIGPGGLGPTFKNLGSTIGGITSNVRPKKR